MPLKDLIQNQLTAADENIINKALDDIQNAIITKTVNLTPMSARNMAVLMSKTNCW